MKLAPSLHRIGSSLVNSYLVEESRAVTIVDAGLPGYWRFLPNELAAMGRSLDDVRAIVLTHGDRDHVGFAERLRRERGVPVFVHELDVARARGEVKKRSSGWGPVKIGPLLGFLAYTGLRGGLRVPPLAEVRTFGDGVTLDVPGAPRIIHLPGHTPGTLSMLFEVKDGGRPLMVAYSGGTAFNFVNDVPHFDTYIASQRKMAERAGSRNATVLMSNHSEFDNAVTKIKMLAARKAGEPHPFELGREAVQRYFKVTDECAQVARLKLM